MKIVILDSKTLGSDCELDLFNKFGEIEIFETTSSNKTIDRIKDADIVLTNKVVLGKKEMESALNLKLICVLATGMNNIDTEFAKSRDIVVKNVKGYSTQSVTQHTFAMAFYLIEQLKYYDEFVKSSSWSQSKLFTCIDKPFFELHKKTWGIIGLGEIGKNVANVAKAFGANIIYYSTSNNNNSTDFQRVSLDELLSTSDIISIHAPLNENSKNLLNYENMKLIKTKAVLLNLGRGGIINEDDLAKILDEKEIFVALDVTAIEPLDVNSPLLKIKNRDNLLITPHIAWSSIEARNKLLEQTYKNIEDFLRDKS
ncbi:MAG: D-2-hydroxyacid dehydrogenase [Campylobacterales bacterium]|nr:D-2-hydroxyacid dehydrogenase [Campylobacterales bacterium]